MKALSVSEGTRGFLGAGLYLGSKGFMLYDRLKCVGASDSIMHWTPGP